MVSPWSVLLFALAAWLVAMGYRDFLKTVLGWISQANLGQAPMLSTITDIQPPANMKAAPPAVSQPSGIESIPGLDGPPLGAQGLLGGGLVAMTLDMVLGQVLKDAGLQGTPAQMARIGARLVEVAPDLLDGNAYLSSQSRQLIVGVVLDLKKEARL